MKRRLFFTWVLIWSLAVGFGGLVQPAAADSRGNMYREFDGIMVFYQPADTVVYRELLPEVFELPAEPLVQVFVIDYYKMAPWSLEPYLEAAVFLLARYKGEEAWHCVTMPVTSEKARIGGVTRLGYPKVLAEVTLDRKTPVYTGALKADGKTILEVKLDAGAPADSRQVRTWFDRLTGIRSLNILNGQLVDPMPRARESKVTMLDLSERYPDTFKIQPGQATLIRHPEAAPQGNGWRSKAFAIEVREIVLAYYFQNKYGFSFGRTETVSD